MIQRARLKSHRVRSVDLARSAGSSGTAPVRDLALGPGACWAKPDGARPGEVAGSSDAGRLLIAPGAKPDWAAGSSVVAVVWGGALMAIASGAKLDKVASDSDAALVLDPAGAGDVELAGAPAVVWDELSTANRSMAVVRRSGGRGRFLSAAWRIGRSLSPCR